MNENLPARRKLTATYRVLSYRPILTVGIVVLSVVAAGFEAIGLGFLLPIIDHARDGGGSNWIVRVFEGIYQTFGIPFTLDYIVAGIIGVMALRYTSSFLVAWLREALRTRYIRYLRERAYENALDAKVSYFDERGSDEILNTIVTETTYAGQVIRRVIKIFEQLLLSGMYVGVALVIAPFLTIGTAVALGGATFFIRNILESGYAVGDRVADANEDVQDTVQAGTQGIRDVKLFGLSEELFENFERAIDQFTRSSISVYRNQAAIQNFYQLTTVVLLVGIIYWALEFTSLSLGGLGVFLFAMFRLAPRVSNLNTWYYRAESELPHLIRTQEFIDELAANVEENGGDRPLPNIVKRIEADSVNFSYPTSEDRVLDEVSFQIEMDELVAFVGPSGTGKSTIASLLARMYEPDDGTLLANDVPITEFDLAEWRSRVSVVRQDPFIFNETLRYNVTLGNRDASDGEIERVCDIAEVTEFLDQLPDGYETGLGDDGVRLSGGQRQRVALARSLLKESDLLILDEATSDLDTSIEKDVHESIESMDRDYGIVVIAHRLSTVRNADRIYAIEDGRIVETGTHKELVTEQGLYADLYRAQSNPV